MDVQRGADIKKIDDGIKNKFQWKWLENRDNSGTFLSDYFRKIDVAGKVRCTVCNITIKYGSSGMKSLVKHGNSDAHKNASKILRENQTLPGVFQHANAVQSGEAGKTVVLPGNQMGPEKCSFPYGAPPNIHESSNCSGKRDAPLPNVSYEDRKSNAEAMVVSFIAENNLPFTMTSKVLDLAKELSTDHKVLADLSLDRTSCTYKLKEGLATVCHKRLVAEMKKNPFSINLDECTAKNNKRVLSVLVSYFSEDLGMSIVHHYVSLKLTTVNANTVFHAVKKALEEDEIPFTNVVSSLSDSAAYMRGSKSGFEKKLQDVATNMLDIDGDLCHHIHNVVKKYCQHFDHQVEGLCDDLYNDFHYSPDLQEHLATISTALGMACKVPLERVAHRWLSSFDVTIRNVEMMKALTVFYFAWVDSNKQIEYEGIVKTIINEAKANKKNVYDVIMKLKMKQLTPQGLKRKKRIVQKLFAERNLTLALMHHYTSVLPMFKSFVLTFEQKEPMIHKAHDSITDLFRQFLACFIKHEGVSELTARQLAELDISGNLLKCSQIYVGKACEKELLKMSAEATRAFLSKVRSAYQSAAQYLQVKLPLKNKLLSLLSAIDPKAQGYAATCECLKKLPDVMKVNFTPSEKDQYDLQASALQLDKSLPSAEGRVDKWWGVVLQKYPSLRPVMSRALSIFTGPRIEQSFSMMNNVINKTTNRLNIDTFNAIQTVKFDLLSTSQTSIQRYHRKDKLTSPVDQSVAFHLRTAYSRHKRTAKRKQAEQTSAGLALGPPATKKRNVHVSLDQTPKPTVTVHELAKKAKDRIYEQRNVRKRSTSSLPKQRN